MSNYAHTMENTPFWCSTANLPPPATWDDLLCGDQTERCYYMWTESLDRDEKRFAEMWDEYLRQNEKRFAEMWDEYLRQGGLNETHRCRDMWDEYLRREAEERVRLDVLRDSCMSTYQEARPVTPPTGTTAVGDKAQRKPYKMKVAYQEARPVTPPTGTTAVGDKAPRKPYKRKVAGVWRKVGGTYYKKVNLSE